MSSLPERILDARICFARRKRPFLAQPWNSGAQPCGWSGPSSMNNVNVVACPFVPSADVREPSPSWTPPCKSFSTKARMRSRCGGWQRTCPSRRARCIGTSTARMRSCGIGPAHLAYAEPDEREARARQARSIWTKVASLWRPVGTSWHYFVLSREDPAGETVNFSLSRPGSSSRMTSMCASWRWSRSSPAGRGPCG